jgi:hypothetical protein
MGSGGLPSFVGGLTSRVLEPPRLGADARSGGARHSAQEVESVIRQDVPLVWHALDGEPAATRAIEALEAQPSILKGWSNSATAGGGLNAPYTPLKTVAVGKDSQGHVSILVLGSWADSRAECEARPPASREGNSMISAIHIPVRENMCVAGTHQDHGSTTRAA